MGIFCDGADVLNAIWYACEGKTKEALTSALCALPGLGMGIGSLMEKTSRFAQAGKTVKYLSRMTQGGMGVVAGISMAKTGFTNILNGLESGNLSGWDIVTFIGGIAITGLSGRNLAISGRGLAGMMDDAGKVAKAGKGQNAGNETKILFRGDRASVVPDDVFQNGFKPKGTHNDALLHTKSNTTAGNFVSTSGDKAIATEFAGKNGYVYVIQTDNYVDINSTYGAEAYFPEQMEFSIPGGVKPSEIVGAYKKQDGKIIGDFIPNPNFGGN